MGARNKSVEELRAIIPESAGTIRAIPGIVNVVATADGRIWTAARGKPARVERKGQSQRIVRVMRADGKVSCKTVAALVALAFIGEPPADKPLVLHRDGDFENSRPSNLVYGTWAEHLAQHGHRGEGHGLSKLTERDVLAIRFLYRSGYPATKIARKYHTTRENVYAIVNRKTWTHLP